jgi:hypothetical protein
MQSQTISEERKIREMDAPELAEYAGRLAVKITEETITPEELRYYNLAKANYKDITGRALTEATMTRR